MIKVFIVDDHKMVIEGLQILLENEPDIKVIGSAMSGLDAIDNISKQNIDIVLLDINMPDLNGIETCKRLLRINPELKIIAISMHKESSLIKMILNNGAQGYVLKNAGKEEVVKAIQTVHSGDHYIQEAVNKIVMGNFMGQKKKTSHSPFPTISNREKDVLDCILNELTTSEIADKLHISFGTVETHRRNMLIKTGARNTAGLVRIALEYGLSSRKNLSYTG